MEKIGILAIFREIMESLAPEFSSAFKIKLQKFVYGAGSRIGKRNKRVSFEEPLRVTRMRRPQ